jgi:hypothetical protein
MMWISKRPDPPIRRALAFDIPFILVTTSDGFLFSRSRMTLENHLTPKAEHSSLKGFDLSQAGWVIFIFFLHSHRM